MNLFNSLTAPLVSPAPLQPYPIDPMNNIWWALSGCHKVVLNASHDVTEFPRVQRSLKQ